MTQTTKSIAAALLTCALLAVPALAADLADIEIGQASVNFNSTGQRLSLDVTGPQDFTYAAELRQGGLDFEIYDAAGNLLSDGTYNYELKALAGTPKAAERDNLRGLGQKASERLVQSGVFTIAGGSLVDPTVEEPARETPEKGLAIAQKALHNEDTSIVGSLCVGFDCTSSESYGFDTLRLKENNLRIKFDDTSSSGSFPNNDWQLTANDSSNGGANKFSIDDVTHGKTPFTVEANSPSNTLYVDSAGRIGIQKSNPVVGIHHADGNSPTLRLEQDGSDGFTAQTWDIAGNESNFFVRDVTHGSNLPFRIKPGSGNDNALYIDSDGDIGFGVTSPSEDVHVKRTDATQTFLSIENTNATAQFAGFRMENSATGGNAWDMSANTSGQFRISLGGSGVNEVVIDDATGDVTIARDLTVSGSVTVGVTQVHPDYVFEEDYSLLPLEELSAFIAENNHLPNIPSAAEVHAAGTINMTEMQNKLLEKVEELTLYTLQQQSTIEELKSRLEELEGSGE